MATIANLGVSVTARTGKFHKKIKGVRRDVTGLASSVTAAAKRMSAFGAAMATVAAGGGMVLLVKRSFDAIDATAKVSYKLGIATEKLAGLRHAAELSGVGISTLDTSLQRMTRRVAEAANGTGVALGALEDLKLSVQNMAGMSPDQQFYAIADAMQNVASQGEKVRLSMALFDTEGVGLLNTLAEGSAGLRAMQKEAEKLGITFSRVDAAKVEAANDAMARIQALFRGVSQTIAIQLSPYVEALAAYLTDVGTAGTGMGVRVIHAFEGITKAAAKTYDGLETISRAKNILHSVADTLVRPVVWTAQQTTKGTAQWMDFLEPNPKSALDQSVLGDAGFEIEGFVRDYRRTSAWLHEKADFLENFSVAIIEDQGAVRDRIADSAAGGSKYDEAVEFLETIASLAQKAAEISAKNKGATGGLDLAPVHDTKAIEGIINGMQRSIETFGMSARAIKIHEMALAGATVEQLANARAIDKQLTAMERQVALTKEIAEQQKSLAAEAQGVFDATRTPVEQYEAQLKRLRVMYDAFAIDAETYVRALKQARSSFQTPDIEKTVAAAVRGTVAGFSASRRITKREDGISLLVNLERKAAKKDDEQADKDDARNEKLDQLINASTAARIVVMDIL